MTNYTTIQTQVGLVKFWLPRFELIPSLLQKPLCAFWRAEPVLEADGSQKLKPNGKPKFNKAPRNKDGYNISKTKPDQWMTFAQAENAYDPDQFTGVGVLLQAHDGIVGIDLDDWNDLKEQHPELKHLLARAKKEGIYCEQSPSGTGFRLFVRGQLPDSKGRRSGGIELYADTAFLTVTGQIVWGGDVLEGQWLIDALQEVIGGKQTRKEPNKQADAATTEPADHRLVDELAQWAEEHHPQHWEGAWDRYSDNLFDKKYASRSDCEMALVGHVTREAVKRGCSQGSLAATVFEVFQKSGLYSEDLRRRLVKHTIPKAISSLAIPIPSNIPPEVAEVNARFALIEGVGVYDRRHGQYVKTEQFHLLYANRIINIGTAEKPSYSTLGRVWVSAADRAQFPALEMAPGEGETTNSGALNTYRGFSVEPCDGDVQPFLELLIFLVRNDQDRLYLLRWMAYKIQHPAARYAVAIVVWSMMQGIGKNLLFETWAGLFDQRHRRVVGQEVFSDQFTEWQHLTLAAIADEVSSTGKRSIADRIKGWITALENQINAKGAPKFSEPNLTAYVFLSNHADAVFMDKHDRRFWVVEGPRERPSKELIENFVRWRDGGGRAALLSYLLSFDTGSFDPRAPAPMTVSKREMIEDNMSDLERWVGDILEIQNLHAAIGRELVTVDELAAQYRRNTDHTVSTAAMTRALRRASVQRLSKQATRKNGKRPRVYALRNQANYEAMTTTQLGEVLDNSPFRGPP